MKRGAILTLVMLTAMAVLTAGCARITQENFDKIKVASDGTGMTQTQVEDILGKGAELAGGGVVIPGAEFSAKTITWKDGNKSITVSFLNGRAVEKNQSNL